MANTASNTESNSQVDNSCQTCHRASCEPSQVAITAIKPDRKYILDLNKDLPEGERKYILRVLARTDKPRIIDITLKGNCQKDHGGSSKLSEDHARKFRPNRDRICPSAEISGKDISVDQPSPIKAELFPPTFDPESKGFKKFLEKYLIPTNFNNAQTYKIKTRTCSGSGSQSAEVQVFQEASWGGSLKFAYKQPKYIVSSVNEKVGFKKMKGHGKTVLSGKIELAVNTEKWEIGGEISSKNDQPFESLNKVLEKIIPFLSDLDGSKDELIADANKKLSKNSDKRKPTVTIHWPEVSFGGKMKVVEVKNKHLIDLEGQIKLDFPTLIGADVKVDILHWIMRVAAPGYSLFLDKIRDRLKDGVGGEKNKLAADIGIDLTMSGKVGGKLDWTLSPDEDWKTTGEVSSNFEFKLNGFVTVEIDVFIVSISAGASAHLGSDKSSTAGVGFSGKVKATNLERKPAFAGVLEFSGAAIYYTKYIKSGADMLDSDRRKGSDTKGTGKGFLKKTSKAKLEVKKETKEFDKLVTLIEPFRWPNGRKDIAILDAKTI